MTAIPGTKLVTIFGGSGFVGRHTVRALANEGWRIRVAVRCPNTAHFLRPMGRVGQIQLVKANVLKDADVAAAVEGADAVINLVGLLTQWGAQRFDAVHVEAAARIARAAKESGVKRMIHVSALGVDAQAPARYFRTKAQGEAKVREAFPEVTIFRPSLMFGPEDTFFNRFAALMRMVPFAFPLFGEGKTRFQPVFVGDVARAMAQVLANDATKAGTYELAGPEEMTLKQVLELVSRETNRKRLFVPLPLVAARVQGFFLQFLPWPPLTLDQARMLETDTILSGRNPGLKDLGIIPTAAEAIIPSYLWRFRKRGQFEEAAA
jgi:uncharacterized protein YbjT (DUF2867 family)